MARRALTVISQRVSPRRIPACLTSSSHAWGIPLAWDDDMSGFKFEDHRRFAFPYAEKLRQWMNVDAAKLQQAGYVARVFMVAPGRIDIGVEQVIFDVRAAVCVAEISISEACA